MAARAILLFPIATCGARALAFLYHLQSFSVSGLRVAKVRSVIFLLPINTTAISFDCKIHITFCGSLFLLQWPLG